MAEQSPRGGAGKKRDAEIAAAEGLLRDDLTVKPVRAAADPVLPTNPEEIFELVENPASGQVRSARSPHDAGAPRASAASRPEPAALVEEVWSRPAEWGPTLLLLTAWLLVLAIFIYFTWGQELYAIGFFGLLVGVGLAIVLSYPILITLERPVRVTPEQAVRDFYGALSHHFPHYRRMWLLLSTAGRTTTSYGSFEGFKRYWTDRLRKLKGGQAGTMTPLVFEIAEYRADKSAGKAEVDALFTLKVWVRGRRQAGPLMSIPAQVSLVRGPDKMWYLESGTLPEAIRAKDPGQSG
jgi:hypothetical protein